VETAISELIIIATLFTIEISTKGYGENFATAAISQTTIMASMTEFLMKKAAHLLFLASTLGL